MAHQEPNQRETKSKTRIYVVSNEILTQIKGSSQKLAMYKIHVSYGNASSFLIWSRVDRLRSRWNGAGCSLLFQIQSSRLVIVLKCKKAVGGWVAELSTGAKLKRERGWARGDGCLIAPVSLGFQLRQSAAAEPHNRAANSTLACGGGDPNQHRRDNRWCNSRGLGGGGDGVGWASRYPTCERTDACTSENGERISVTVWIGFMWLTCKNYYHVFPFLPCIQCKCNDESVHRKGDAARKMSSVKKKKKKKDAHVWVRQNAVEVSSIHINVWERNKQLLDISFDLLPLLLTSATVGRREKKSVAHIMWNNL